MSLNIIENYLTKNRCYQQARKRTAVGIQVHSIGTAQNTAQNIADYWNQSGVSACVHYVVDAEVEGKVLHLLPDTYYAWADGGYGNRNLITFEIAESDYMRYTGGANYVVTNEAKFKADIMRGYKTAVQLCAYLCKQHGWNPMTKLASGLYLISSHDEGRRAGLSTAHVDPTHIWSKFGLTMDGFRKDVVEAMKGNVTVTTGTDSGNVYRVRKTWADEKSQIGAYSILANAKAACKEGYTVFDSNGKAVYGALLSSTSEDELYRVRKSWADEKSQIGAYKSLDNAKAACPTGYAVYDHNGKEVYRNKETAKTTTTGLQAKDLNGLSEAEKIKKVAPIYQKVAKETGMLASVGLAQFCLESGYGTTDLAQNANNMHGMKASLSGNTWSGSTWDGKSTYTKRTAEQDRNGNVYYVTAAFRKYPCIEDSVRDRATYFIGAKNGSALRYPNINKITNATEQIKAIKAGGYATDVRYVDKLTKLVNQYNLTQYDTNTKNNTVKTKISLLDACKKMNAEMMADRKKWIYSNHSDKSTWAEAKKVRHTNCANFAVLALKEAGIIPMTAKKFYGSKGEIKGSGADYIKSVMNTVHINGKKTVNQAIKDGTLKAGDVVMYQNITHTNIYAGNGKWYDAGRAYCEDHDTSHEGQEFITWYGDTVYGNQKISYILRQKSGDTTQVHTYRVQAGAFSVKTNAEKLVSKIKDKGLPAILKQDGSNYIVQCGVFNNKDNAQELVDKLVANGFDAIIK